MESFFFAVLASLAGLTHTPNSDRVKPVDTESVDGNTIITEEFITSSNSDCQVFNPNPQDNETIEWSGECTDGYADGEGVVRWYVDGEFYEKDMGIYHQGKANGYVVTEWYDDQGVLTSKFFGEMLDGKRTQGTLTRYDNSEFRMYSGGWKGYEFHGQGMVHWSSGSTYSGGFENGTKSGFGVLSLVKNDKAPIAEWKEKGLGHYKGDRYVLEGVFKDDDLDIECKIEDCPAEYFDRNN